MQKLHKENLCDLKLKMYLGKKGRARMNPFKKHLKSAINRRGYVTRD